MVQPKTCSQDISWLKGWSLKEVERKTIRTCQFQGWSQNGNGIERDRRWEAPGTRSGLMKYLKWLHGVGNRWKKWVFRQILKKKGWEPLSEKFWLCVVFLIRTAWKFLIVEIEISHCRSCSCSAHAVGLVFKCWAYELVMAFLSVPLLPGDYISERVTEPFLRLPGLSILKCKGLGTGVSVYESYLQ